AWSDNQPDYHWMQPHEVKTAYSYWFPVRDTRGVHMADQDFALNTDLQDGQAFGAVYATGRFPGCKIILKNARTDEVLSKATADLAPDRPYKIETPAGDAEIYDLHLSVRDQNDKLLIELQQQKPKQVELPEGHRDPGDPQKMNADELYFAGEWLDKFRRTNQALLYYGEALKRDPSDARVNAEMGIYSLKQGKWKEALDYFQTALQRDGDNARLFFGCGVAWRQLGDLDEAYNQFYRATYSQECYSQAYFNLAKIDLARGGYEATIEKLEEAVSGNGKFADIHALQAAAFRRAGRQELARLAADKALSLDPLHFMGGYEMSFSGHDAESEWRSVMRGSVQNYLELSVAYAGAGLLQDADRILALYAQDKQDSQINPMVNYFRGYLKIQSGDSESASEFFRKAKLGSAEHVNPHRLEGKAALEAALKVDPADANAHLFLGNLLYAKGQREDGFAHWREALKANPDFVLALRNVAYGERHLKHDAEASYQAYQKAAQLAPRDATILFECDQAAEAVGVSYEDRLAFLLDHLETVQTRDNLIGRLIDLRLIAGDKENLQKAYETLSTHHFHSWEGRYEIHFCWMEVNQKLGDIAFDAKNYPAALHHYEEACLYPKNLEVAARTPDFRAHVYWNLAKIHRAMNHEEQSRDYLQKIIAEKYHRTHIGAYCQALAYKELGDAERSQSLLDQFEKRVKQIQSGGFEYRGAQALGHYLASLLLQEKGDLKESKAELEKALTQNPRIMRNAIHEAQLDIARAHQ
ncbi:MAG: tetratricopeptide repeat protein, partial [Candidatus Hinthialibacter sp.]